jgi:uncharacterized protein (TIGR03437 family)
MRVPTFLPLLFAAAPALAQQYAISTVAGGAPPPTPIAAKAASIGDPARVAVDAAGNIYFSSLHSIFRVDASGTLTRYAGNGRAGNSGDNGPAAGAQLNTPMGMAFDAAGNLFVADRDASVVRKISPNGIITTAAGADAGLAGPYAVALDAEGTLYVADTGNQRVVRIGNDGRAVTIAGFGSLDRPEGVAVDSTGTVYVADTFNGKVRRIGGDGTLITVAGAGSTGVFGGDNNPAVNAGISLPTDIAFDAQGSLYVADFGNARVRKITAGIISTIAGATNGAPEVEGEPILSVRLEGPTGIAIDRNGTLYFAEGGVGSGSGLAQGTYRVWTSSAAGTLAAVAGNGAPSFSGDGGSSVSAQLNTAADVAVAADGTLYIADTGNQRVRRVDPDGAITTILGNGTPGFAVEFGAPGSAMLHTPRGIAVDPGGAVTVADTGNSRVRKFQAGGNIFTYAGNGNASYFGDEGAATRAAVNQPEGVAFDAAGNLYIADTFDNAVRKVTPAGTITTVAGTGQPGFAGDGGPAIAARLNRPRAVAADAAGNVYVADTGNQRVRRIDLRGVIATVAGNGSTDFVAGDAAATSTALSDPRGVAVDAAGNVYIADTGHNRVRKVFPSGAITTIAGTGSCCYSGDGGLATAAQLNQPWGLALDAAGNLFVADSGNSAIRVLRPVSANLSVTAVTNAASNAAAPVAPGELVTIYGTGLDTVRAVRFNGLPAPLLYATTSQVGAVAPYGVQGASAQVTVENALGTSPQFTVAVAAVSPGIFTANSSGTGQAAALNQDGSVNGTARAAGAGEVITLYATGEGATSPAGVDGRVGAEPLPKPLAQVAVFIGGAQAEVQYAGGTPKVIAGVMQINAVVPGRVFGTLPLLVTVGGVPSQSGVTIAVR